MRFTTGNLLDSNAEALVNTVNTVGVMGKGIALMFKERFPQNYRAYLAACEAGELHAGHLYVTERSDMYGPRWIINFPTKKHWRHPSKLEWIRLGLKELRSFIETHRVKSVAVPPLGAGNGGLSWSDVRLIIEGELDGLQDVDVLVFEPTAKYQNVAKATGVQKLTPARALIAELVRQYAVLGLECTLLEVQKLAWFLQRNMRRQPGLPDALKLDFSANRYGPYADSLRHLFNGLDGSYLKSDKRLADAGPLDVVRFDDSKREQVAAYLTTVEAKQFRPALDQTVALIDGFESPLGLELLATVDWLLTIENVAPTLEGVQSGVRSWAGGAEAADRKAKIFEPRLIELALERLIDVNSIDR